MYSDSHLRIKLWNSKEGETARTGHGTTTRRRHVSWGSGNIPDCLCLYQPLAIIIGTMTYTYSYSYWYSCLERYSFSNSCLQPYYAVLTRSTLFRHERDTKKTRGARIKKRIYFSRFSDMWGRCTLTTSSWPQHELYLPCPEVIRSGDPRRRLRIVGRGFFPENAEKSNSENIYVNGYNAEQLFDGVGPRVVLIYETYTWVSRTPIQSIFVHTSISTVVPLLPYWRVLKLCIFGCAMETARNNWRNVGTESYNQDTSDMN